MSRGSTPKFERPAGEYALMDCLEFDRRWDALLDSETAARAASAEEPGGDRQLVDHGASCPRCGPIQARNLLLQRALRAWAVALPLPPSSAALVDQVLASAVDPRHEPSRGPIDPRRRRLALGVASAIAASLFLAVSLAPRRSPLAPRPFSLIPRPSPLAPRPFLREPQLTEALAGATSATWGLARATTGEAAQFGRRVLEAAGGTEDPTSSNSIADPDSPPSFLGISSASTEPIGTSGLGWLQDVGEGLTTTVRPLSTTAERAFGFLRVRATGQPVAPSSSNSSKGA